MRAPSPQNAIDIFLGEWSSKLPINFSSGPINLFEDSRISLIAEALGSLKGKEVLELGPLEAAHSSMMSRLGAQHVTAVEANTRAYLKCLITKELLNVKNVSFLLGNFDDYIKSCKRYDFILACGVIYHCRNPVETISNLCKITDEIGIWSHYFIKDEVQSRYGEKFELTPTNIEFEGNSANCYKHYYQDALDIKGFCGGGNLFTFWMDKESWINLFTRLGFKLEILAESTNHPNGPEFTAVARRVRS